MPRREVVEASRQSPVVEPATGEELGRIGIATPQDVDAAARCCAAAALWAEHAEEIAGWNVREVGAVPAMAGFAGHVAEQESWLAARPASGYRR